MSSRRSRDDARPLPKRTRERLAACAAIGLSYWSDHPARNCVWAIGDHQDAHVVRIERGTAQHVCGRTTPVAVRCTGDDEMAPIAAIGCDAEKPPGAA
jgi:hypothetical protein